MCKILEGELDLKLNGRIDIAINVKKCLFFLTFLSLLDIYYNVNPTTYRNGTSSWLI